MAIRFSAQTGFLTANPIRLGRTALERRRVMRRWHSFLAASAIAFPAAAALSQAPNPPQLNVPYRCANGITYTILVCKPFGADQWCQWREDQNGQTVTTVNSAWTAMTGRLQGCTTAAAVSSGSGQALNPAYLREFPSVDEVMARMKGSDAKDTANRQMGAFEQLKTILQNLAGSRWMRGQLTPDEARIRGNYDLAYNNLAKPLNFPDDGYFANPDFVATLFTTFPMPTVQQQWLSQNAALAARVKARQQQGAGQAPTAGQGSPTDGVRPLPPTDDPGQLAIRRCAELGGSMLGCIGTGMGTDMGALGLNLKLPSGKPGLVMFGAYTAASGLGFGFGDLSVNIGGCGKMVQGAHNYSISASGGKYTINIANTPQPLVVTLGADGKMAGPAAQDITGQQVTGYEVVTNLKTGAVVSRTPIYGPITVHCNVGTLTPGPAVDVSAASAGPVTGMLGAIASVAGVAPSTPAQMLSPGPRMVGTFTGTGGLRIQFSDANAIVDCAQAHVKVMYDVKNQASGAAVVVQNGSNPFSISIAPNGSLAAAGPVKVDGKLMIGMNGSDPVFSPTSASCPGNALVASK